MKNVVKIHFLNVPCVFLLQNELYFKNNPRIFLDKTRLSFFTVYHNTDRESWSEIQKKTGLKLKISLLVFKRYWNRKFCKILVYYIYFIIKYVSNPYFNNHINIISMY